MRGDDVARSAEGEERGYAVQRLLPVAELGGGVGVLRPARPPRVPVEDDAPTRAGSRSVPATGARVLRVCPRSATARKSSLSAPACGTIAEWYFSAPAADWRHWKKHTASAPWATCTQPVTGEVARPLGHVDRLPVHGAGGVLHEEPRAATGDAADQVGGEGQLVAVLRAGHQRLLLETKSISAAQSA